MGSVGKTSSNEVVIPENVQNALKYYTTSMSDLSKSGYETLRNFVENNQSSQGTTYRGLDITDSELSELEVGGTLNPKNVVESWSKSMDTATTFATFNVNSHSYFGNNPVVIIQPKTKGVDVSGTSKFETEQEILTASRPLTITDIQKKNITTYNNFGQKQKTVLTILKVK